MRIEHRIERSAVPGWSRDWMHAGCYGEVVRWTTRAPNTLPIEYRGPETESR